MTATLSYTYDQLIAAIQTWAEDASAELVAALPQVVARGESKLYTDLNFEIFDGTATGDLTANQNLQAIKTGLWQGTRSLYYTPVGGGARTYLQRRTYEWCNDYEPDEANTAPPIYFAEFSPTEYFVVPAPDQAYPFVLRQIARDSTLILSSVNQNTWLGDNAGDLLLDTCMIETELYIESMQFDIQKWKDDYAEKLPQRRIELRQQIRSDYAPIMNAARTVDDRP